MLDELILSFIDVVDFAPPPGQRRLNTPTEVSLECLKKRSRTHVCRIANRRSDLLFVMLPLFDNPMQANAAAKVDAALTAAKKPAQELEPIL
jgi:hypothetical protein